MKSRYYDIATDFYEYGWGDSFHFSVLKKKDTKEEASLLHEYRLAMKLGLTKDDKILVSELVNYFVVCELCVYFHC